jgi:phosphoribosylglycinamide formyltransferase-1
MLSKRPLRVAVLCSRRAPGLVELIEGDRRRGSAYEIVCVLTSEPAFADQGRIEARGVPVVLHSIAEFYARRGAALYRDFETRRFYDRATVARLEPYDPDLLLFDGYLFVATRPLVDAFPSRVLNLHFSDLSLRRSDGRPLYPGIRAVRDAIADGQNETSATVHLVNDVPDGGAPIARSWPYPVSPMALRAREWGATDMLKAYAFAHQEWMMRGASAALLAASLALIADGRVDLDALGEADPATVSPWLVDEQGRLTPPKAVHICERLWRYRQAAV